METPPDPPQQIATRSGASPDTEEHIALASLVRSRRLELGMSQRELSRRSKVPQPHICEIESGSFGLVATYRRLFAAMGAAIHFAIRPERSRESSQPPVAIKIAPAATSAPPAAARQEIVSPKNTAAKIIAKTTLSLSMGATREAGPRRRAR